MVRRQEGPRLGAERCPGLLEGEGGAGRETRLGEGSREQTPGCDGATGLFSRSRSDSHYSYFRQLGWGDSKGRGGGGLTRTHKLVSEAHGDFVGTFSLGDS